MNSIIDYLEHWAAVRPDQHYSSFLDIEGNATQTYTYRGFHNATCHLAEYLSQHVRIRRGDRVLLVYPAGLEVIVAFVSCARIGAIPVPVAAPGAMGFAGARAKLAYVARDCQATVALTTAAFQRSYRQLMGQRQISASSHAEPSLARLEWVTTDDVRVKTPGRWRGAPAPVLFLQYTSGSTSHPRGVIVSHENVIHGARSTIDHTPIGVSWLPQHHDMGLIGYYLYPLVVGGETYGFSPLDFLRRPSLWLLTMSRVRATYASAPNFGFEHCLRDGKVLSGQLGDLELSSLRVLMNASEPVRADTYLRFLERFARYGLRPQAHVVAYGLAENTLAVTHYGRRAVTVNKRLLQHGKLQFEHPMPSSNEQRRIMSCGKSLDGIHVRIVNPESRTAASDDGIGEIWVTGKSVCQGYWGRPGLTRRIFRNTVADDPEDHDVYLRTGDLGFLHENELFVCGRIKDLIIIRGVNHYPQDIETVVESASAKIRRGGVAALSGEAEGEALVVVAEVRTRKDLPDPARIADAIRTQCGIEPHTIVLAAPGAIARTTSGKISRSLTRQRWLAGELPSITTHVSGQTKHPLEPLSALQVRFQPILAPYNLTGHEQRTLAEVLDSLTLVWLSLAIESLLQEYDLGGHVDPTGEMDARLLQRLTVAEFFSLLEHLERRSAEAMAAARHILEGVRREQDEYESARMRSDARLILARDFDLRSSEEPLSDVLLTGPTGFFGPFLLSSLLRQTTYIFHALTRARNAAEGMERIRSALRGAQVWTPGVDRELERRVRIVCGDIAQQNLGLQSEQWRSLARRVQAVFHNAALVNYVLNYDALRPHNVHGTRELLRFAFTGTRKEFHFISSTVIFGWTGKATLFERDNNEDMEQLDFGYAQTKWVAEQLVLSAEEQGLNVRVYRPSFITASRRGVSSRADIVIRLLAFMINHGIAVEAQNQVSFLPADIAADNIVAIFSQRAPIGRTFHVTADDYYSLMEVTRLITSKYGYEFEYYDIPSFIVEMKRRCTKDDLLYPLLEFFSRSAHRLVAMQHKRYSNDAYRKAKQRCGEDSCDPPLQDTVSYLIGYMVQEGLIPPSRGTAARGH